MRKRRAFDGKLRWTPVVAIVVAAAVLTGTMLANAAGPPLPKRTPAQLLADMRNASPPAAMSAVITENANLGFPSLPDIAGLQSSAFSAAAFLTGTHTFDIWYAGPRHIRIAVPVSFGETDLRVNGNQVWLWDSHGQTATHYVLPAPPMLAQIKPPTPAQIKSIKARLRAIRVAHPVFRFLLRHCAVSAKLNRLQTWSNAVNAGIVKCIRGVRMGGRVQIISGKVAPKQAGLGVYIPFRPLTPQRAATKFLAAIGASTKVSVGDSTVVAGRPAYQLIVAPRTNQSLISRIVVAIDARTYMPLRLQVFARGMSSPAFQVGYTSLTIGIPAASNFTFTPPAGAHVKTVKLPQVMPGLLGPLAARIAPIPTFSPFTGPRWLAGPTTPAKFRMMRLRALPLKIAKLVARSGKLSFRRRVQIQLWIKRAGTITVHTWAEGAVIKPSATFPGPMPLGALPAAALSGAKVLGSGWLSVAVIPAGNLAAIPSRNGRPIYNSQPVGGPHPVIVPGGSAQGAQILALLRILLNSAARVHGSWGSGRLLRTSLLSVLITNNGKVLIGAVSPAVLYADAAKVK